MKGVIAFHLYNNIHNGYQSGKDYLWSTEAMMLLGFASDASGRHGPVATGPCFNHPLDGREKAPHLWKRGGLRRVEPFQL